MKHDIKIQIPVGDKTLTLAAGTLALQAGGAVTATMGETVLFSAVTAARSARDGIDFLPLQVEYREKYYAAGRFPGGYFKRESRPSEREILIMRITDRPLRPLFPSNYHNELQINNALLSCDGIHMPDSMSVNAASAALMISEVPLQEPVGAVRVGRVDGQLIIEPTPDQLKISDLDLLYAGCRTKMMMMEGEADEISEEEFIAALKFAHHEVVKIIDGQVALRAAMGLPEKPAAPEPEPTELFRRLQSHGEAEMRRVMTIADKLERRDARSALNAALKEAALAAQPDLSDAAFSSALDHLEIHVVRSNVLEHGQRVDGRGYRDLRPLDGEVSVLPRCHGSAWFGRGETQSLGVVTLGSGDDVQELDAIVGGETEKKFMLHYNFPPYCVGETGRLGATSRREIGHGNLAERALKRMIPSDYPYAVRVVSEIMGSNGSSSMASACVGTLALMDAGVPIRRPVAGISAGLFTAPGRSQIVLDILGTEDHCGDMDFKVCGTSKGITSFQVDLKIPGLDWNQIDEALEVTRTGRLQILDFMAKLLPETRTEISRYAPRIHKMNINPEKIGALIGPGGKHIRGITDSLGVKIDISDDGTVIVFSADGDTLDKAIREINGYTAEPEPGTIYEGRVTGVKDFGAFVEILPGIEGLVHVSEIANERVQRVDDYLKIGERVRVLCVDVLDNGKISLSIKRLPQE